ncbi:zinc ABC transporter permease [Pullulanibacillus camelliae]|uniref:Zinc ABC transporter permease n=1 Tax=Pullulanibacillus camelliae TaxID=1707096 RepID=A0A8J2VSW8_9BACL|nr:metal ABC transporter permease [Pullulanibacillus camelliae]GGE39585.1 zinc ABC transporter permease [Pullulanibacillus camelliae]
MKIEFTQHILMHALIGGVMASIICGIIGIIVLEKRLVMMSGGIAHSAIGGMGLGYFFNFAPMIGAVVVAVLASLGIGRFQRRQNETSDVLIGIFWAVSMAIGVFLMDLAGKQVEFEEYLFGNIFTISTLQLWLFLGLMLLLILVFIGLFHAFKAYLFDEEYASVQGLNVRFFEWFLFIVLGFTTILMIKVVGMLLVIALYSAPPAIAKRLTKVFYRVIILTIVLNLFFVLVGVVISYVLHISSGTAIVFLTGITYFTVMTIDLLRTKQRLRRDRLINEDTQT